ncbi:MAG: MFS transporter [Bryobacteraceae bacterium]|nr:MFS transporter [Bryobacteraceae bacterium]
MRWIVLAGSVLLQTCLGSVYAWSTFVPNLVRDHGLSGAQAGMVFGLAIGALTAFMVLAGRMLERFGPRRLASAGAVLFGAGYWTAGASGGQFPVILAGAGLLSGAGTGLAYVCPLSACIRWFPRHQGLVTGIAVAGFGGGAMIVSGVAGSLLHRGVPVLDLFRWMGLAWGAAALAGALALQMPPSGGQAATAPIPVRHLLRHREFQSLTAAMFAGTFAGLLVAGNLKPMGLAAGLPPQAAVLAVQIFAFGNAAGRISWGWIFDRMGRVALPLSLLAHLVAAAGLAAARMEAAFLLLSGLCGFCFGSCFVLNAAQTAAVFGHERLGAVYPYIFLAYGLSGLTAPAFGGWIYDVTGSFGKAIGAAAAILTLGAVAVWRGRPADAARS